MTGFVEYVYSAMTVPYCMNPPGSFLAVPPTVRRSTFSGRNADADGHGLSVFPAGAYAFVELQIVADHRNAGQHIGAIADQRGAFDRRGDLPSSIM